MPECAQTDETPLPRVFRTALFAALFTCASFAAAASALLLITYALHGSAQPDSTLAKLWVKTVVFLLIALETGLLLWRSRRNTQLSTVAERAQASSKGLLGLLVVLLLIALEIVPNLARYPWAAPDETYHMTVARNLSFHGLYASGDPDAGFTMFDPYDSVGAPVIAPIAGALRLAGPGAAPEAMLIATRVVMLAYYFLLCIALFFLGRPLLGSTGALAGLLLMSASFGSTYLARTLYGEVPALAFFASGLICWRRGLTASWFSPWLPFAGLLFGMSVLCKSILILTAFAFLGALLYDAATFRRTRLRHYFVPAVFGTAVIAAWWTLQALLRHGSPAEDGGTISFYQHYLMFGYRSALHAVAWVLQDPLALIGLLSGMGLAVPLVFHRRYDPALVVLFLGAVFFAFWWIFFTPGQIPRYVWFSYAIAALFTGGALWDALRCVFQPPQENDAHIPPLKGGMSVEATRPKTAHALERLVSLLLVVVVLLPAGQRVFREVSAIYTIDEMRDDRELALWVRDVPESSRVATTYWPLARTLNVLGGRHVDTIGTLPRHAVAGSTIITDSITQPEAARGREPSIRMGRYMVFVASP